MSHTLFGSLTLCSCEIFHPLHNRHWFSGPQYLQHRHCLPLTQRTHRQTPTKINSSQNTTCTGICIKMHNYSKPCNCKHYFITCVSKGANINKYRNCFTRANHCSCWEPIINIRHAQLLKDGTKKSLVLKVLQMYTPGVGLHCQSPVSPVTGWPAALCVCG